MSVIDKYPFINAVLTSLSDEDLASLQECVNGAGGSSVFKSILAGSPHLLKTTDKGVYPIELEVAPSGTAQTVYPGFLIYNDDYCVLISFATERSQILTVLDLHLVNGLWSYEIKPFELSITDLRSELFDVAGGGGGASPSDVVSIVNNALNNDSIDIAGRFAAPEYDPEETYAAGSVVAYNNRIYVAKEDSVTGEWNSAKWDEKKLTELVGGSGGGEPEEVEIKIYFSDLDAQALQNDGYIVLVNQEKLAIIEQVANDINEGKLGYGYFDTPWFSGSHKLVISGAIANAYDATDMHYALTFGRYEAVADSMIVGIYKISSEVTLGLSGVGSDLLESLATLLATDATKYISLKFKIYDSVGSSDTPVTGDSGKLYEYSFELSRYENGSKVDWSIDASSLFVGSGTTELPIRLYYYESNFERTKAKLNELLQAAQVNITINTPQDLVTLINGFNDTQGETGFIFNQNALLMSGLINFADKAQFYLVSNGLVITSNIANSLEDITLVEGSNVKHYNFNHGTEDLDTDFFYGLNTNNSCTFAEYGTSSDGQGGVNVESNIVDVCFSSHVVGTKADLHLYMFKNDYQEWLENNNATESELLSTFNNLSGLEQIGFLQSHIGSFFQEIKSIRQAVKLSNNNSLKQAVRSSYIIDDLENPTIWSFSIDYISGTGAENHEVVYASGGLIDGRINEYDHPCTLSISTLDLVNVTGGQGGGSVEAEPIISIKMTNVDGRDIDANPPEICNLQFYCTKERWDNFVALANSEFQTQITYQNFDSVFKALDRQTQTFALGYLMMDYYEGKVLPDAFAYTQQENDGIVVKNTRNTNQSELVKGTLTNNIEIVMTAYFDGLCAIPNGESISDTYTTENTVITVEEIAGPVIGSSSGSDSSEGTEMQRWTFTFDITNDVFISVYTKFTQSELSAMLAETNTNIDGINSMMSISLNHINSFDDIGTLIAQSQTIDSTGVLTETLIGTFMSGLCHNEKTISILQDSLFGRRTVVNCYPTVDAQMQIATNYNCVIVNDSNQFVTLQINGTYADASYEEI